jgi:flagellin-specific chaperone FliS
MRTKQLVSNKLDKIESHLKQLKHTLNTNDRDSSYKYLKDVSEIISDINTLLNRETQE